MQDATAGSDMTADDEMQGSARLLTSSEQSLVKILIDEAVRADFPDNPPLDKDGNLKFGKLDEQLCRQPMNDLGNVQRLLARHSEKIKYVANVGWYGWDGTHWAVDDERGKTIAQLLVHQAVKDMRRELLALISFGPYEGEDEDAFKDRVGKYRKFVNNSGNASKLNAMLEQVQPYLAQAHDDFDTERFLLTVENGTIDLNAAGGPRLLKHNPAHMISKKANVRYVPGADCPEFKKALSNIQPDDSVRDFMQRYFGYCLTGDVSEQIILMWYGPSAGNGKSTLMDLFSDILGGFAGKIPIESLMAQDRTRSGSNASPDIARLPAKRMITASEPEAGEKFSERIIKLISGEEKIMARHLNQGFFEFALQGKMLVSFNDRPGVRGGDEGFWRRVLLVPFEQQFKPKEELARFPGALERDPELPKKLRDEAPGILNWMIEG